MIGLGRDDITPGKFLKKDFGVTPKGWWYEVDKKCSKKLMDMHKLDETSNPASSLGDRRVEIFDGSEIELNNEEHSQYRTGGGVAGHQAFDRLDTKYASKEILRDAAQPTRAFKAKLKRLALFGWEATVFQLGPMV